VFLSFADPSPLLSLSTPTLRGSPMTEIPHDRPDQLQQIQGGLMPGETLIAVYDAIGVGTGFLGLTSHHVIIQDKSFVGKKLAITSVPYSRITSVSVLSNKSLAG
jgi:hypothetical protein